MFPFHFLLADTGSTTRLPLPSAPRWGHLMVRQEVITETGADLIRAPVHAPPALCVLQAACHSHTAGHQSRHRGEYSGAHRVTQRSFQTRSHSWAGGWNALVSRQWLPHVLPLHHGSVPEPFPGGSGRWWPVLQRVRVLSRWAHQFWPHWHNR